MNAARLHRLVSLHERRRRGALGLVLRLVLALLPAAGIAAAAHAGHAGNARSAWFALALATALVCIAAPYLLYWWPGATLLARLPIGGPALLGLAVRRMLAGLWPVLLAELAGAAALGLVDPATAGRALIAASALLLAAALLTPALGALAGILSTSDRLRAQASKMAGQELATPPLLWLSLMPALGVIALVCVAWVGARWALVGADLPVALAVLGGAVAAGALLLVLARRLAADLPAATRDVAALDAMKLATLQLDQARGLERLVGLALAGRPGRQIFAKDVALARRRFPLFYILTGLAVIIGVGVGVFADEPARSSWALGLTIFTSSYVAVLGARLAVAPLERPRLLAVLPIPGLAVARGKLALLAWRSLWAMAPAAAAIVHGRDRSLGLLTLSCGLTALLVGFLLARRARA
jgi:hypothetical protein